MARDEVGAALTSVDEQEMAESIAVEKPVQEMRGEVEGVVVQGHVPLIVRRDDYMVPPLRYKMMTPTCNSTIFIINGRS